MKDLKKLKKELDNLKREISNLSFYIDNIVVMPKDRNSARNHQNARATLNSLDNLLKTRFKEFEQRYQEEVKADNHSEFIKRLGKTNSPTNNMMKQSMDTVEVQKNFKQFVKNSMQRTQNGIPQQNLRKSSTQDTKS